MGGGCPSDLTLVDNPMATVTGKQASGREGICQSGKQLCISGHLSRYGAVTRASCDLEHFPHYPWTCRGLSRQNHLCHKQTPLVWHSVTDQILT